MPRRKCTQKRCSTKARYKKRTAHRRTRKITGSDLIPPPWGIPDGNGHYRVVPPN